MANYQGKLEDRCEMFDAGKWLRTEESGKMSFFFQRKPVSDFFSHCNVSQYICPSSLFFSSVSVEDGRSNRKCHFTLQICRKQYIPRKIWRCAGRNIIILV